MLFCLAWCSTSCSAGISGVFLLDVPSDVTTHGSFFSMAHFHYTIMGGLVFTFFAAIYYWLPKMTGFNLNERLGEGSLLDDVHCLQFHLRAAVRAGLHGHAATGCHLQPSSFQALNELGHGVGVRARYLDADSFSTTWCGRC